MLNIFKYFFCKLKKFITYGINGIINVIITYPIFILLSHVIDYRLSIIIVYPIGILISYLLNRKFVFKTHGNLGIFSIIMVLMLLTNLFTTWILVEYVYIIKEISQIIAIGVASVMGYLLNKRFSFKQKSIS